MCKHKSGGMSKPSGAATPQGALSERTTASCPSHNCPPESSSVPASTSQSTSIQNQMQMNSVLSQDSQAKSSERASIPVTMDASWSDGSTNGTHNTLLSDLQCNVSLRTNVEDYSCLPKAFRESIESEDSVSEDSDSDVATEQSPMLLSQACSGYCTPPDSWNSSIFSAMGSNYKNIGTKGDCSPDHASENDQENSCIADSVKFSTFKSYQVFNNFQVPNSYIPPCGNGGCTGLLDSAMETFESQLKNDCCFDVEHGTKLLFARHKCKPIKHDSLTVDNHISVICPKSYEYIEPKSNDIVEELSLEGSCNSCMTATYSSSTINTDPIAGPSGLQRPNSIHWEIGAKDNDKEDEFRCRSYSLTPTVNFAVFESESASETEDVPEVFIPDPIELHAKQDENTKGVDEPFQIPVSSLGRVFPISPSAAQLSLASSYGDSGASICKICHMTAKENDPLISPCRCSGTMQYIHCGCLMRWLEISSKRSRKPASCELCQYQYHWHKKFKVRHWKFPHCSRRDKILHFLFFISMVIMIACATITIMCFKQDKGTKVDPDRTELTQSEIITLICGVMFFLAFFVAMYVEVKSRNTIYKLLVKFIYLNQQWYIDEYEKKEAAPVSV